MNGFILALIGGAIIGVASSLLFLTLGRIAGISGIFAGTLEKPNALNSWKYFFIIGLILGGLLMKVFFPEYFSFKLELSNYPLLILAGLLVGFGTRLGSGCTSGHGVCGIPRLSKRSILATLIFIGSGIVTVALQGTLS